MPSTIEISTAKRRKIEPEETGKTQCVTSSACTSTTLPEEILRKIGSYLSDNDLLTTARVNRRWRAYSKEMLTLEPPAGVYGVANRQQGIEVLFDPKLDSEHAENILGFNLIACAENAGVKLLNNVLVNNNFCYTNLDKLFYNGDFSNYTINYWRENFHPEGANGYFYDETKNLLYLALRFSSLLNFPSSFVQTRMLKEANAATIKIEDFFSKIIQSKSVNYTQLLFDIADPTLSDFLFSKVLELDDPKSMLSGLDYDWKKSLIVNDSDMLWEIVEKAVRNRTNFKDVIDIFSSYDQISRAMSGWHDNDGGNFLYFLRILEEQGPLRGDDVRALFRFMLQEEFGVAHMFTFMRNTELLDEGEYDAYAPHIPIFQSEFLNFMLHNY